VGFSVVFYLVILIFNRMNNKEVITAVFDLAGYTYGPLLGLFSFGAFLKRPVKDRFVPFVCILAPILTYIINDHSAEWFNGYKFGFERLIINGLITFIGLWLLHDRTAKRYVPQA
jgi:hypothetical protein